MQFVGLYRYWVCHNAVAMLVILVPGISLFILSIILYGVTIVEIIFYQMISF
jgi:hypothetical protein